MWAKNNFVDSSGQQRSFEANNWHKEWVFLARLHFINTTVKRGSDWMVTVRHTI